MFTDLPLQRHVEQADLALIRVSVEGERENMVRGRLSARKYYALTQSYVIYTDHSLSRSSMGRAANSRAPR